MRAWISGKIPQKKAALFYGPAGVGKTSLVEAAANEYKLSLVEMNASDFRRREDIERVAKIAAMQRGLFTRGKIILLDEVDGISGTADRGGLDALLELINITRNPIVMTANDPWDQKLKPLRDASLLVPFYRLKDRDVIEVLKNICKREGIECEQQALRYIASRAEGDLRSAINDLEAIARAYGRVTMEIVQGLVATRDREYSPWEMLRNLFMSKYVWQAKRAITHTNIDYDTALQWINENIALQYTDPEDQWRAYEALARADQYLGRIKRTQSWELLSYVFDLAGPGVALARRKSKFRWIKYQYPQKILLMAKTREVREVRESIAAYLASRLHTSKRNIKNHVIPYLFVIFRENPVYAARIALAYNFTNRMIEYLAGARSKDVINNLTRLKEGRHEEKREVGRETVHEKVERTAKRETVKGEKTPSLAAWLSLGQPAQERTSRGKQSRRTRRRRRSKS